MSVGSSLLPFFGSHLPLVGLGGLVARLVGRTGEVGVCGRGRGWRGCCRVGLVSVVWAVGLVWVVGLVFGVADGVGRVQVYA